MVVYPFNEWGKYMAKGKVRTFVKDTPSDIIEKAKQINDDYEKHFEKKFFHFEAEEESN